MYIDQIAINNLRCFAKTSVEFTHPAKETPTQGPPNVTLLLGDNGSGKSTALKAIYYCVLVQSLIESC